MTHDATVVTPPADMTPDQQRELAIKRIKDKSDFKVHVLVYALVNAMLVVIWAVSGGLTSGPLGLQFSYFWPIFPIVGWGVAVVIHGYTVYRTNIYTEEQIQREIRKLV